MMTEFTPMLSVSGGRLIVLSAVAVFIFFGRILGISGIIARTLNFDFGKFVAGFLFNRFGGIACGALDGVAIAAWI